MISRPFLAGAVGTLALFSITAASFGDDVTAKYPVPVKTMQEAGRLPIRTRLAVECRPCKTLIDTTVGPGKAFQRQALRPVLDNIQLARERAKPYLLERCRQPCRRETCSIAVWVDQSAGERVQRQIGSLRHEEDPPFAKPDFAAAERPKSGQCPQ